ncbi:MAG: hypothetical protein WC121_06460 [Candidatus Kapaibacterium sp.]
MELRKIKYNSDKVEIKYDIDNDSYRLSSYDKPRPEFIEAMQKLVEPLVEICEFQEGYGDTIDIISVSISHSKGIMGATITGLKKLDTSYAPLVINTPHLPTEDYSGNNPNAPILPDIAVKRIEGLIEEAELYINGKRSQLSILDDMEVSNN